MYLQDTQTSHVSNTNFKHEGYVGLVSFYCDYNELEH